ncbi:hypothetical protein [Phormidium sp. FACHB-592]|uniref:ABC transmembrane type-1 domain-containing protein n=1 Tax=Stenomitos frigidus AS-A4 TaxID=2933935 RepID=A0ABV0KSI4_9CYAN|nr:hypothetical protein [Phormidium sp. FACHB-592]
MTAATNDVGLVTLPSGQPLAIAVFVSDSKASAVIREAVINWAIAFTVMLLLPLSVNFARLVQQTRLESSLRAALLTRTITFQSLELVSFDTN